VLKAELVRMADQNLESHNFSLSRVDEPCYTRWQTSGEIERNKLSS